MKPHVPTALALALAAVPLGAASAQTTPAPVLEAGHALLTVSADGRSTRAPDLALFTAGVTSQATTASAALAENSRAMNAVVTALKSAGIAGRDIQTSNLSLNPVYAPPKREPDGTYVEGGQKIIGYQVTNSVNVKQRRLEQYGRVIDTLVSSGANQVNGPSFQLDQPDAALDEARTAAVGKARQRAELYARAAGLRIVRILSISEGGGYSPAPRPVMYRMAAEAAPAPPPVESGELEIGANVTIQFELAP
ncbi:MAG: SIMPL domain-containing protein [Novosphingobium sp.]